MSRRISRFSFCRALEYGVTQIWQPRGALATAVLAVGLLGASRAFALEDSKKPTGANHAAAHALATGAGVNIVVIEPGGTGANAAHNLETRLKSEYTFVGMTPGQDPTDNSAVGDDHSTLVADIAAGADATHTGVAPGANVYFVDFTGPAATSAASAQNDADHAAHTNSFNSYRAAIGWLGNEVTGQAGANEFKNHPTLRLFNNSWGVGYETNDNGDNRFARFIDWYASRNDALFVSAAGNCRVAGGSCGATANPGINWPSDNFNGITVGALERIAGGANAGQYQARVNFSQYWLGTDNGMATDIRGKPDILAPGHQISDGETYGGANQSGTSFATPHVTGAAALVMERAGLGLPGPSNRDHLAVKSILLNSAHKRHAVEPHNSFQQAHDHSTTDAQASDHNYLDNAALRLGSHTSNAQTTSHWTPAEWLYTGSTFVTTNPLDDEQGVGSLDARRAMVQVDGGEQNESRFNPNGVGPIGWSRDAVIFGGAQHIYPLNFGIAAGTFITTTLTWDRLISEVNAMGGTMGGIDTNDTYDLMGGQTGLPDLDLRIYYQGLPIASSISVDGNVEHLHIPVWQTGAPNDYELRVNYASMMNTGQDIMNYGIAWWTHAVPEPASAVLLAFGWCVLLLVRRPRGELAVP